MRLGSFLLASLLIHLGVLFALPLLLARQGERQRRPAAMTLEYLEFRGDGKSAKGRASPDGAVAAASRPQATPPGAAHGVAPPPAALGVPRHQAAAGAQPPSGKAAPAKEGTPGQDAASRPAETAPARGAAPLAATAAAGSRKAGEASAAAHGSTVQPGAEPGGGSAAAGSGTAFRPAAGGSASSRVSGSAAQGGEAWAARRDSYQARLRSLIEAHKQYPLAARKSGQQGSCRRRFALGRDGTLRGVESLSSCGHPFLDGAATRAITAVGTFPPLPEEFAGEESFTITITFTLARQ